MTAAEFPSRSPFLALSRNPCTHNRARKATMTQATQPTMIVIKILSSIPARILALPRRAHVICSASTQQQRPATSLLCHLLARRPIPFPDESERCHLMAKFASSFPQIHRTLYPFQSDKRANDLSLKLRRALCHMDQCRQAMSLTALLSWWQRLFHSLDMSLVPCLSLRHSDVRRENTGSKV